MWIEQATVPEASILELRLMSRKLYKKSILQVS